ncbi:hypothetical protein GCM10009576_039060 [Streptomyces rhizosphaericus]|uniref:Uncharacterized protein n=1 Tax=Streptomyces rhizosphaericus TaxID=114699 RepID=A0ABN1SBI9_9ACTN
MRHHSQLKHAPATAPTPTRCPHGQPRAVDGAAHGLDHADRLMPRDHREPGDAVHVVDQADVGLADAAVRHGDIDLQRPQGLRLVLERLYGPTGLLHRVRAHGHASPPHFLTN